jgi:hypothetical protein
VETKTIFLPPSQSSSTTDINSPSTGLPSSHKIAIGVGVSLGVIAFAALGILVGYRWRKRSFSHTTGTNIPELQTEANTHEMRAQEKPLELEGTKVTDHATAPEERNEAGVDSTPTA